ncbi:flagellar basal-body rod protein FlgG [Alphaproteobacteria bacterium LSUCC0744]
MSTFAMHVAKTGLNSQQVKMQVIANNLANVNTTGFKSDRANFESLLYQILRGAGESTSENTSLTSGLSVGTGTRLLNTSKLFTQGSLIDTGNSLDLAVEGDGFFQVLMPDGRIGYTRAGAFSRNAEGAVTTASGYPLQPEIQIPEDALSINVSSDGIVTVQLPGGVEAEEVGQITLADFPNKQGLQPNGESMLIETPASGAPIVANPFQEGMGRLVQGAVESSNVNVVQQLVDMIETQRAYEVSSKTITSVDEMMRYIAQNL